MYVYVSVCLCFLVLTCTVDYSGLSQILDWYILFKEFIFAFGIRQKCFSALVHRRNYLMVSWTYSFLKIWSLKEVVRLLAKAGRPRFFGTTAEQ